MKAQTIGKFTGIATALFWGYVWFHPFWSGQYSVLHLPFWNSALLFLGTWLVSWFLFAIFVGLIFSKNKN